MCVMYVCMYVHMYVCTYMYVCIYVDTCMYIRTYVMWRIKHNFGTHVTRRYTVCIGKWFHAHVLSTCVIITCALTHIVVWQWQFLLQALLTPSEPWKYSLMF